MTMNKIVIGARGHRDNRKETLWLQNPATGQYSPKKSDAYQFGTADAAGLVMQRLNTGVASEVAPGFKVERFEEVPVETLEAS